MNKTEIDTKFEIAEILVKHLDCDISKVLSPLYDYLQKQLILSGVSISLPSQKDYDNRKLKAMYFKKDTSVGNSVLFTKGEQWQPYNWNYQRTIDYLKEGRLGYEC